MAEVATKRPLLILLPGLDGSGRLFAPLVAALGAEVDARVISYPADRALGYPELADLVCPQLPADRPFVLLGESFSGPVAIRLAAARPPGLAGLVLCCTFARNPRPWLGLLARPLLPFLPIRQLPVAPACRLLAGRNSNPHWRAELRAALAPLTNAVLRARLRAVLRVDVRKEAAAVDVPVLLLRAKRDRVVPASAAGDLSRATPQAASVELDAPHLLLQVAADAVAIVLKRFVTDPPDFAGGHGRDPG